MSVRPISRAALAGLAAALALGACAPGPPQAPLPAAKRLGASTGDISTECGLAYQVTAFPGDHKQELANLGAAADASVRKLASVYHRNPAWNYQGETVGEVVNDAVTMLKACGLSQAATTLQHLTSHHRS
jgi:hypothetical protein